MKNQLLKTLSLAVVALFAINACGPKEPDYGEPAVKASPASLEFGVEGGSKTVSLTATVKWTVSSSQTWVTVEPLSGDPSKETQTVTVTVTANDNLEREAELVFSCLENKLKSVVKVSQAAYVPAEVQDKTAAQFLAASDLYKYQKVRLSGVVKSLKSDGSFSLKDESGSVTVAGLSASEVPYGTEGGKLSNVAERDAVTIVGYRVDVDGKAQLKYGWLESVTSYSEPDPNSVATKSFPYEVDYTSAENGVVVNNPVFPYDLEYIWSWSSNGWTASGYKNKSYTTESCLYTEKVDLKGAKKPVFSFEHRLTNFNDYLTARQETSVWISKDGGEWTKLPVSAYSYPNEEEYAKGDIIPSESISLEDYIGSVVQFKFTYTSKEDSEAGTWQIRKVSVTANEEPDQPENSTGTEDYNKPDWEWNK